LIKSPDEAARLGRNAEKRRDNQVKRQGVGCGDKQGRQYETNDGNTVFGQGSSTAGNVYKVWYIERGIADEGSL